MFGLRLAWRQPRSPLPSKWIWLLLYTTASLSRPVSAQREQTVYVPFNWDGEQPVYAENLGTERGAGATQTWALYERPFDVTLGPATLYVPPEPAAIASLEYLYAQGPNEPALTYIADCPPGALQAPLAICSFLIQETGGGRLATPTSRDAGVSETSTRNGATGVEELLMSSGPLRVWALAAMGVVLVLETTVL